MTNISIKLSFLEVLCLWAWLSWTAAWTPFSTFSCVTNSRRSSSSPYAMSSRAPWQRTTCHSCPLAPCPRTFPGFLGSLSLLRLWREKTQPFPSQNAKWASLGETVIKSLPMCVLYKPTVQYIYTNNEFQEYYVFYVKAPTHRCFSYSWWDNANWYVSHLLWLKCISYLYL